MNSAPRKRMDLEVDPHPFLTSALYWNERWFSQHVCFYRRR